MSAETLEGGRRSPARDRVLETAQRLFYAEGVHSVGIDRIIAEAGVAKATFYHHFPSKDELVRAFVTMQSSRQRAMVAAMRDESPYERLRGIFAYMCEFGAGPGYRGCPFVNTAAEYPDPAHPVRQAIAEHRRWNRELYRDLLAGDGRPDAERVADILMLLRDGLVVGFDLDDPVTVRASVQEALTRVLD
ncbi:TetR/AcrR family transcriptional regulator [Nonomuraea sp. KM90]|uniref:TetR/AcrR family transcriptional regulator n=1 Tax=Nonomuraea sp. KM90 TaxID=3457428 RepID=UPI003FCC96BE